VEGPVTDSSAATQYNEDEIARSFQIARSALAPIGSFRTPPTPEVYSVWYRYVEGTDQSLVRRISYLMNDAKVIDRRQMNGLIDEFLVPNTENQVLDFSEILSKEMRGLQSIAQSQLVAGAEFNASIMSANANLNNTSTSQDTILVCVTEILSSNAEMQAQLSTMKLQLEMSQDDIEDLNRSLLQSQKAMMIDLLTGVGNRRFFDTVIRQSLEHSKSTETFHALLHIDFDCFKQVNDTHVHEAGDFLLKFVANELQRLADHYSSPFGR